MISSRQRALGSAAYFGTAFALGAYFAFAAVQGDHGMLRRSEVEAEERALRQQHEEVVAQVAKMENLTRRMSDDYLDLDLLDQQARDVLGMLRPDEMVIR